MAFTTLDFLIFYAVVFLVYYLVPRSRQWLVLLAASWIFYAWHSLVFPIFLMVTVLATFIGARIMADNLARQRMFLKDCGGLSREDKKAYKARMESQRRAVLTVVVGVLLGMLGVFKYLPWVVGMWGGAISLILPIGLSFYIFQSIAYCVDVYREEIDAERNLLRHALYVSFFPQIMQGPIGNYGRLAPQLFSGHEFDYQGVVFGAQRAAYGFFKKLVCANTLATIIDPVWTTPSNSHGCLIWLLFLVLYAVQLYADFSGYMDIACGCSQMLGVRLDENFNCPYFSKSVPEYWRRWHVSLSSWFKDYLFYPLLRSEWCMTLRKRLATRKYLAATIPTALALTVVWLATGLWHGASWGYVAWGGYYGLFMIGAIAWQPVQERFDRCFPRLVRSKHFALWRMGRTFLIVLIGYAFFRPADLELTAQIFHEMVKGVDCSSYILFVHRHWQQLALALAASVLIFTIDAIHYCRPGLSLRMAFRTMPWMVRWGCYVLALLGVIVWGTYGDPNLANFAYFQF